MHVSAIRISVESGTEKVAHRSHYAPVRKAPYTGTHCLCTKTSWSIQRSRGVDAGRDEHCRTAPPIPALNLHADTKRGIAHARAAADHYGPAVHRNAKQPCAHGQRTPLAARFASPTSPSTWLHAVGQSHQSTMHGKRTARMGAAALNKVRSVFQQERRAMKALPNGIGRSRSNASRPR